MVLRRTQLHECDMKSFKKIIKANDSSYTAIASLRGYLAKKERTELTTRKIRYLQNIMRSELKEGGITTKRRVPGTGEKVIVKVEYRDTPENRKMNRVGQTYDKVTYKNAEYTDYVQKKMRRYKTKRPTRVDDDGNPIKRRNVWIEAVTQAKANYGVPNLVVVRKEVTDKNDPDQVMGKKVYIEAKKILARIKEEIAAEKAEGGTSMSSNATTTHTKEEPIQATQVVEEEEVEEVVVKKPVKKRARKRARVSKS